MSADTDDAGLLDWARFALARVRRPQATRQLAPGEEDAATASGAAEPDVAADAGYGPGIHATGMGLPHLNRLVNGELRDASLGWRTAVPPVRGWFIART